MSAGRGVGMGVVWPGLVFSVLVGMAAMGVSWLVGLVVPAVSALLVAIVLGVVVGNVMQVPCRWEPGMAVASKRVLRVGIVALGLSCSLVDVVALGWGTVVLVVAVVVAGFVAAEVVGRLLGVSRGLRTLIGAGSSICGAAAVAGVEDLVEDKDESDVVTALALVVLFGTLMIPLIPVLAGVVGFSVVQAGRWVGASTHEVAQVVAGAGVVGPAALTVAVMVKLGRVVMLAPVAAVLSLGVRRRVRAGGGAGRVSLPPVVPLFVVGFLVAVGVRSVGVVPVGVLEVARWVQVVCLSTAMFALGCGVKVSRLRAVGGAPVVLAAVVTGVVVVVGGVGAGLLGA